MPGDRLAFRRDEPRRRRSTALKANGRLFDGLLAGDIDRCAPLVLGVEDMNARGRLRGKAVQLEPAVADGHLEIAAPEGVERLDPERREDEACVDRLSFGTFDPPLDRHGGPQRCGDFMGWVAGLGLVRDDGVGVVTKPAGFIVVETVRPDLAEDVVAGGSEDEQMSLALEERRSQTSRLRDWPLWLASLESRRRPCPCRGRG